jgi:hypothetical protein
MVGICICKRHGRAGLADVCQHIARDVSARVSPAEIISARFDLGTFAGITDAPMVLTLHYCRACAGDYRFPPESGELPEEELEAMWESGPFRGACDHCLYEVIYGRSARIMEG